MDRASPYLYAWKDNTVEFLVEEKDASGVFRGVAGLTDLTIRIAETEFGPAIGTLTGAATERSSTLAPGQYYRVFDLAALTSELPSGTYPHRSTLWVQLYKSGDVEVDAVRKVLLRTRL